MFNPWYSNYLKSYDMSMLISEYILRHEARTVSKCTQRKFNNFWRDDVYFTILLLVNVARKNFAPNFNLPIGRIKNANIIFFFFFLFVMKSSIKMPI